MNFTLHLTESCNMNCCYCIREKTKASMSYDTLKAACDLAFSIGTSAGLCFFGGEPLLEREKILFALDYCEEMSCKTGKTFACKMTTNGTLLDKDFILRAKKAKMGIGVSFDGTAQKISRKYKDGSDTFKDMERVSKMLLSEMPDSYAMLTLAPEAVHLFFESVKYLYELGFHKITATPAYGKNANWTDEKLAILENELQKLAEFYGEIFLSGKHFFFSPFDSKIRDCIESVNPSQRCHLGMRQMPVAPDGKIYACTQFIGDDEYCFGDVFTGIDASRQTAVSRKASEPSECRNCDLKSRCTNSCGCMNRMETGDENRVSPLQCTYERMLISISDELADTLFEIDRERFMKRFAGKLLLDK